MSNPAADVKPGIWFGHVTIAAGDGDVEKCADFYLRLGMREVHVNEDVAVLEVAGGTHLVVLREAGEDVGLAPSIDLMVDDVDATRAACIEHGFDPGEVVKGPIHRTFEMHDPGGNHVAIHDSHVGGTV